MVLNGVKNIDAYTEVLWFWTQVISNVVLYNTMEIYAF